MKKTNFYKNAKRQPFVKTLRFEKTERKRNSDGSYSVLIDTSHADYFGCSVIFRGLDWSAFKNVMMFNRGHFGEMIGKFEEITITDFEVRGKIRFFETEKAEIAHQDFLDNKLTGFSIQLFPTTTLDFPMDQQRLTVLAGDTELVLDRKEEYFKDTLQVITAGIVSGYSLVASPLNAGTNLSRGSFETELDEYFAYLYESLEGISPSAEIMLRSDQQEVNMRVVNYTKPIRRIVNEIQSFVKKDGKIDKEKYAEFFAAVDESKGDVPSAFIGLHHAIHGDEKIVPKYLLDQALVDVAERLSLARKGKTSDVEVLEKARDHLLEHYKKAGIEIDPQKLEGKEAEETFNKIFFEETSSSEEEEEKESTTSDLEERINKLDEKIEESLIYLDYLKRAVAASSGGEDEEDEDKEEEKDKNKDEDEDQDKDFSVDDLITDLEDLL